MDRNLVATPAVLVTTGSLSARRAWIEMLILVPVLVPLCVALRKESVDRNAMTILPDTSLPGRSPQGERG